MRCSNCGSDNRETRKFCAQCGVPLVANCPRCGASNQPGDKFCGDCGAALITAQSAATQSPTTASTAPEIRVTPEQEDAAPAADGERKMVTALFADIKGSTELEQDLDPEEARAIIDPALKLMIEAVRRYDGYIVQSTGDGIFALFGAPVAHENHPQLALLAGLRMQQDLRHYSTKLREQGTAPLELRIGANTGEVVVRSIRTSDAHVEYTPIGHTTNLAARMQTLAPTGSIAVTESTQRLCEGYFAFRALGPTRVRGVSEPINVHEVTGMGALRTRLQRAAQRGLTKFVGRESEMAEMRRALDLVKQGRGQIVAAMGEAGLGKSRLLFEFKATSQSGCLVLETFSISHGKASAYLPVIELLNNYFDIEAEDDARKRREKITGKVLTLDRLLEDALPYLFALLGVEETVGALAQMDAQLRQRRTLEAIKRILLRESLNQPLIVVFEDLHWIDAATQVLLDLLVDAIANARVLLLVNYRPEYRHGWGSKTHYAQLRLDPLGQESAKQLLDALLGNEEALQTLKRLIIEKTHGNPFFIEETVQVLFDQGALVRDGTVTLTKPLSELSIPPTVQMILASRIDRLPADEKDLLQTLAVMGKEFPLGLIRKVTGKSDDDLERILSNLQLGEFIYEQPALPDVEYTFKHALTLEVAYNSVLTDRRRALHERTADALESLYAERLEDHLAELAHHYGRSANSAKAIDYMSRAGEQAIGRSAVAEGINYLLSAIELLKTQPDSDHVARQEIRLQMALGAMYSASKGFGSPEREGAYRRAQELCERIGDERELVLILWSLTQLHIERAELQEAQKLAEHTLQLSEHLRDPTLLIGAYYNCAELSYRQGEPQEALLHVDKVLTFYERRRAVEWLAVYGVDLWLMAVLFLALSEQLLGRPDEAVRQMRKVIDWAHELSHPYSLAIGCVFAANLCQMRGEAESARDYSRQALSLCEQYGFPELESWAHCFLGWSLTELDRGDEGLQTIALGLTQYRATGGSVFLSCFLRLLAEGWLKAGNAGQSSAALERAFVYVREAGERIDEAELHRLSGESLLTKGAPASGQAERSFREAIGIARRQQTRWWEFRATTSLARLLAKQGRRDDARAMLAEIYNWFTEGFDTADLKDAKVLLDELSK